MAQIQQPRGTVDILPGDTEKWQFIESQLAAVLGLANYHQIRLPVFEHTELFKRGVGDTTDIVNKEMYTFEDKSQRSLTLRPEGTAGVVRAILSNSKHFRETPQPVKLWYCGPMFRYERPQTGRQRQFHQVGVEVFGSEGPAIDAEVIALAVDCMHAVGVKNFAVHVNSIGCNVCRPAYREKLKEAIRPHLSHLCEDCQSRFERNPLRMLDCKQEMCRQYYRDLPSSLDSLCADCQAHWSGLQELLPRLGVLPVINDRLVRGLDYYGRTVFELIADHPALGVQSTICAGGRYDYLVEGLGGQPTAAVGWALGMERISIMINEFQPTAPFAFVVSADVNEALTLAADLRRNGFSCEIDYPPRGAAARSLKRQFEQANKVKARWTLVRGEAEIEAGTVTVKNMADQTQTNIPVGNAVHFLGERVQEKVYNKG